MLGDVLLHWLPQTITQKRGSHACTRYHGSVVMPGIPTPNGNGPGLAGPASTTPGTPASVLSAGQLASLASAAGWTGNDIVIAVAIALAETGGKNERSIKANSNGTYDWGPWQVNDVNNPTEAEKTNPASNAEKAHAIFLSQGWKAWSTYNSGAYLTHMTEAAAGAKQPLNSFDVPNVAPSIPNVYQGITDAITTELSTIFGNIAAVLLALVLLVIGVLLVLEKPLIGTAKKLPKVLPI
jgi:hypothetical protein